MMGCLSKHWALKHLFLFFTAELQLLQVHKTWTVVTISCSGILGG